MAFDDRNNRGLDESLDRDDEPLRDPSAHGHNPDFNPDDDLDAMGRQSPDDDLEDF